MVAFTSHACATANNTTSTCHDIQDCNDHIMHTTYLVVGVDDRKLEVPVDIYVRHSKIEVRPDVLRVIVVAVGIRGTFCKSGCKKVRHGR